MRLSRCENLSANPRQHATANESEFLSASRPHTMCVHNRGVDLVQNTSCVICAIALFIFIPMCPIDLNHRISYISSSQSTSHTYHTLYKQSQSFPIYTQFLEPLAKSCCSHSCLFNIVRLRKAFYHTRRKQRGQCVSLSTNRPHHCELSGG